MKSEKILFIIDRFEGDFAVVEYGRKTFNIPKEILPQDIKEGTVINISVSPDIETTEKRLKQSDELRKRLFK